MRWTRGRRHTTARTTTSGAVPSSAEHPLLSVVVPVYNVQRYLAEAVASIQAQTYGHLEIILVDDGSSDGSERTCDEIAAGDERVRVIHQANGGLSRARNAGLAAATADFVAFADSDDLVPRTAYERMMASLLASGSDFVTGNVRRFDSTRDFQAWNQEESHRRRLTRSSLREHPALAYDLVAWNKIFRREFVDRTGLTFPVDRLYEDMGPMARAYRDAEAVDVLPQPVYWWRQREEGGSITQRLHELPNLRAKLEAIAEMHDVLQPAPGTELERHVLLKLFHGDLWVFSHEVPAASQEYVDVYTDALRRYWTTAPEDVRAEVDDLRRTFYACAVEHGARAAAEVAAWFKASRDARVTTVEDGRLVVDPAGYPSRLPRLPEEARVLRSTAEVRHKLTAMAWRDDVLEVDGWAFLPCTVDADEQELEVALSRSQGEDRLVLPHRRRVDHEIDGLAKDSLRTYAGSAFTASVDLGDPDVRARFSSGTWVLEVAVRAAGLERTTELVEQDRSTTLRTVTARHLPDGTVATPVVEARQPVRLTVRRPRVRATRVRLDRRHLVVDVAFEPRDRLGEAWLHHENPVERSSATLRRRRRRSARIQLDVPEPVTRGDLLRAVQVRTVAGRVLPVHVPPSLLPEPDPRATTSLRSSRRGTLQVADEAASITVRSIDVTTSTTLHLRGTAPADGLEIAVHRAEDRPTAWEPLAVDAAAGTFDAAVDLSFVDAYGTRRPRPSGRYAVALRRAGSHETWALRTAVDVVETFPRDHRDDDARLTVKLTATGRLHLQLDPPLPPEERSLYARRRLRTAYGAGVEVEPEDAVFFCVDLGSNASDSALALHRELLRRDAGLTLYWGVDDHAVQVPPGGVPVAKHGRAWFEKVAASRYLVNNYGGIDGYAPRPHQRYLQTWHGTPYKFIGRSLAEHQGLPEEEVAAGRDEGRHWHALVSPSPYFSQLARRELFYDGPLLETGYPRNDVLAGSSPEQAAALRERLGIPTDAKVLLYAPTFRDLAREGWSASLFTGLDLQALSDHLGEEWVVLLRGHSFNARHDLKDRSRGRVVDATHHHDINELYLAADALVTDYSSAMFDFCVTGKPILYFVPDLEQYVETRGVYFDLEAVAPGPWCATQAQVHAALDALDGYDAAFGERYRAFRERFAPWDDGGAAARVVDAFFDGV
jgi:CDP-glycerol glycerophosphotransferase